MADQLGKMAVQLGKMGGISKSVNPTQVRELMVHPVHSYESLAMLKTICRPAVQKLIEASWNVPMLNLEDVFWNGIVAQKAGIEPFGENKLFHYYFVKPVSGCIYSRIISSHMCKYQHPNTCNPSTEMRKAHKAVVEHDGRNCSTFNLQDGLRGVSCSFNRTAQDYLCE